MTLAEHLSSTTVAALVTAMVNIDNKQRPYTLVVGLGITGLSVVRHLLRQGYDADHEIVVVDSRAQPPSLAEFKQQFPQIPVYTGAFDEALFLGAGRIVVSPGVAMAEPVIQSALTAGVEALGDIELFAREVTAPVVAITGSNGKSTVTTLVGDMAKRAGLNVAVGGNLGIAALDLLNPNVDLYVLELSSFQLETPVQPATGRSGGIECVIGSHGSLRRHGSLQRSETPRVQPVQGSGD